MGNIRQVIDDMFVDAPLGNEAKHEHLARYRIIESDVAKTLFDIERFTSKQGKELYNFKLEGKYYLHRAINAAEFDSRTSPQFPERFYLKNDKMNFDTSRNLMAYRVYDKDPHFINIGLSLITPVDFLDYALNNVGDYLKIYRILNPTRMLDEKNVAKTLIMAYRNDEESHNKIGKN